MNRMDRLSQILAGSFQQGVGLGAQGVESFTKLRQRQEEFNRQMKAQQEASEFQMKMRQSADARAAEKHTLGMESGKLDVEAKRVAAEREPELWEMTKGKAQLEQDVLRERLKTSQARRSQIYAQIRNLKKASKNQDTAITALRHLERGGGFNLSRAEIANEPGKAQRAIDTLSQLREKAGQKLSAAEKKELRLNLSGIVAAERGRAQLKELSKGLGLGFSPEGIFAEAAGLPWIGKPLQMIDDTTRRQINNYNAAIERLGREMQKSEPNVKGIQQQLMDAGQIRATMTQEEIEFAVKSVLMQLDAINSRQSAALEAFGILRPGGGVVVPEKAGLLEGARILGR